MLHQSANVKAGGVRGLISAFERGNDKDEKPSTFVRRPSPSSRITPDRLNNKSWTPTKLSPQEPISASKKDDVSSQESEVVNCKTWPKPTSTSLCDDDKVAEVSTPAVVKQSSEIKEIKNVKEKDDTQVEDASAKVLAEAVVKQNETNDDDQIPKLSTEQQGKKEEIKVRPKSVAAERLNWMKEKVRQQQKKRVGGGAAAAADDDDEEAEQLTPEQLQELKQAEREYRIARIEEELEQIVKEAEETEMDGEEMDAEAIKALKEAALKNCYVKKYYNVFKDEIVYFPSISSKILDFSLIEEAEEFYYDEDDEFPQWETIAIRDVVGMAVAAAEAEMDPDEIVDDEYMSKLAMDVEL